jgi:hypothetical protein
MSNYRKIIATVIASLVLLGAASVPADAAARSNYAYSAAKANGV